MTGRTMKTAAVIVNVALIGLTVLVVTSRGIELEGLDVVLVLLMILAPVLSVAALYWPSHPKPALPAPQGATEGQR